MSATGIAKAPTPAPVTEPDRRLFDVHAAAQYLVSLGAVGTTVHAIRQLIGRGDLPFIHLGKKFFVTKEALDGWIHKNERRTR